MVASPGDVGVFVGGVLVGVLVGIAVGPLLRLWLTWHEWKEASREARLTEDVLERMDSFPPRSRDGRKRDDASRPGRRTSGGRWRPRP